VFGFVASYGRMALKVANYNNLKREADNLRTRYQNLQKVVKETNTQMADLQFYAKEVSMAYGIKQKLEGPTDIAAEGKLLPTYNESLEDYNFLLSIEKLAATTHRSRRLQPAVTSTPSLWPVEGRLMSGFAQRTDPFSGEGAFHKGVDISAPSGTPVRSTAEGVVVLAEPVPGGYGRLVIIDHGGGVQTYYAHLSRIIVHTGQEVHRGDMVGNVGSTGRVTAPHLHYEVRMDGTPRNPIRYLSGVFQQPKKDLPF
jgi:murein DD-endopeptidase MepM/ murein hydrolase activator NlpD